MIKKRPHTSLRKPERVLASESKIHKTEKALVDQFLGVLNIAPNPWGVQHTAREFFYQRGRTDVIALDSNGRVFAFEAKLTKWRRALHQAYRNTCFAHHSYVLLPKRTAVNAHKYTAEFRSRGVGLCYIADQEGIVVLLESVLSPPPEPWLSSQAALLVGIENFVGRD